MVIREYIANRDNFVREVVFQELQLRLEQGNITEEETAYLFQKAFSLAAERWEQYLLPDTREQLDYQVVSGTR